MVDRHSLLGFWACMWVSTCICMYATLWVCQTGDVIIPVMYLHLRCRITCSIKAYTPTSEQMTISKPIVWLVSHLVLTAPTKNHSHNQSPYICLALPSNLNWCECSFKCLCSACAVLVSGPSPGICYIQLWHCFCHYPSLHYQLVHRNNLLSTSQDRCS